MNDAVDQREITLEELTETRRYAIVIEWSDEDNVFVVSVPDISGLHTHGDTHEEAATMAAEAIAVWIAADRDLGIELRRPKFSVLGGF
jgi:predicted RNase H-like HicB family nuclease